MNECSYTAQPAFRLEVVWLLTNEDRGQMDQNEREVLERLDIAVQSATGTIEPILVAVEGKLCSRDTFHTHWC